MMTCFEAWAELVAEARRKEEMLALAKKLMLRMMNMALARCFQSWSEHARKVTAMLRFEHSLRDECRHQSIVTSAHFPRQMALVKRLVKKMLHGAMLTCFEAWMELVMEAGRKRDALALVKRLVLRMMNMALARCFQSWSEHARQMVLVKRLVKKMLHGAMFEGEGNTSLAQHPTSIPLLKKRRAVAARSLRALARRCARRRARARAAALPAADAGAEPPAAPLFSTMRSPPCWCILRDLAMPGGCRTSWSGSASRRGAAGRARRPA
jgi:hypothetical protein